MGSYRSAADHDMIDVPLEIYSSIQTKDLGSVW